MDNCTYANTPKFTLMGLKGQAKCLKVYDGDTIHLAISVDDIAGHLTGNSRLNEPSGRFVRIRCRMAGYNTAELKGAESEEEKAKAIEQREALRGQIEGQVVNYEFADFDQYDRPITKVTTLGGLDITKWMIEGGAIPYNGRGAKKWK
jgi:endonuclease YncB( thermonuclease family)